MTSSIQITDRDRLAVTPDLASCLFDGATEAMYTVDASHNTILLANQAALALTGHTAAEVVGKNCRALFSRDLQDAPFQDALRIQSATGSAIQCRVCVKKFLEAGEEQFLVRVTEATNRITSSSKGNITNDPAYLREMLDDIGAIVWQADVPYAGINYISGKLTSILGYCIEEWIRNPSAWEDSIHPEDREAVVRICSEKTARGENHTLIYRAMTADGRVVWIEDRICVLVNADGQPERLRGVMIDITKAKEAEAYIRDQKTQHQLLLDNAPVCIHGLDANAKLSSINPKGMELIGADSAQQLIGADYLDFVSEVDRERVSGLLDDAYHGHARFFQFRCQTERGERIFKSNFIPVTDPDGQVRKVIGTSEDITESTDAIEKLRVQQRAIESANLGILIAEVQHDDIRLVHCNAAFEAITHFQRDQVVENDGSQLVVDDTGLTIHQLLSATLNSEQSKSFVQQTSRLDGSTWHSEISISAVTDEAKKVTHLVCFWDDVTERNKIESKLRESEHLFRTLSEHSPNGVILFEIDGNAFYLNEACAKILGKEANQCLKDGWTDTVYLDDRQSILNAFEDLMCDGQPFGIEVRINQPNGKIVWVYWRTGTRISDQGDVVGYVGSMVDITQRKRDLQLLAQNEHRYRTMVQNAPEGIVIYDTVADRFVDWNNNALKMFGVDSDLFRKLGLAALLPPHQPNGSESLPYIQSEIQRVLSKKTTLLESQWQNYQGRSFCCEVRVVEHAAPSNSLVRLSITDVSEQRESRRKMQRIQLALENTSDAMYVVGPDSQIIDVNQAACDALGYSREELQSKKITEVKSHFSSRNWSDLWEHAKKQKSFTLEMVHARSDGTTFPVEVSAAYSNAEQEFVVALARDITDRTEAYARIRERESQLAHVSRLSTMGELVAGIAHEVNQPLYSIMNFAKATKIRLEQLASDGPHREEFSEIAKWNANIATAASNAGDIIHRMGNFVSQGTGESKPAKVDDAILDALELLAHELKRADVTLFTDLNATDTYVVLDRLRVQQIIVNLVINAIEAIHQQRSIRREVVIRTKICGDDVTVSVSDSGPGFTQGDGSSLIEAFTSTKENAMGMGLAVVNTIIESYDGGLAISKSQTGGAEVCFSVPKQGGTCNV